MSAPSNWKALIEQATKHEATVLANVTNAKAQKNIEKMEAIIK